MIFRCNMIHFLGQQPFLVRTHTHCIQLFFNIRQKILRIPENLKLITDDSLKIRSYFGKFFMIRLLGKQLDGMN